MWQQLYKTILQPKAPDEDARRKELILNVLLFGVICLTAALSLVTVINGISTGSYSGTSPLLQLGVVGIFIVLLYLSRRGWYQPVSFLFIGLFLLLALWPVIIWGVGLPQVVLAYSLIIVMTGVLINSRMAFYMAVVILAILLFVIYLEAGGVITFNTAWRAREVGYSDVVAYGTIFLTIALVAWLSNREIDRSLRRARRSEKELRKERSLLEVKVRERTKELEKTQMEKMMGLQRFAEFGRLSATLLHELANPLTSVALNLDRLEGKEESALVARAREGIAHMEEYVEAARRQLRHESEVKEFDVAQEIRRVEMLLGPNAMARRVELSVKPVNGIILTGDTIKFNHIIANLVSNAIDAYEGVERKDNRTIQITMARLSREVEIIVTDHGRGVTAKQLPRLFEPFYTTKQSHGTGIGLVITKQAVEEAFNGTIRVKSDAQGTRFIVRLPLK